MFRLMDSLVVLYVLTLMLFFWGVCLCWYLLLLMFESDVLYVDSSLDRHTGSFSCSVCSWPSYSNRWYPEWTWTKQTQYSHNYSTVDILNQICQKKWMKYELVAHNVSTEITLDYSCSVKHHQHCCLLRCSVRYFAYPFRYMCEVTFYLSAWHIVPKCS